MSTVTSPPASRTRAGDRPAAPFTLAEAPRAQRSHRVVLMVGAISLFGPALSAWASIVHIPAAGVVATLSCMAAVVLAAASAMARTEKSLVRLDYVLLCGGVLLLAAWAATALYSQPAYGTDEAAFIQYASQLLIHGKDPYGANLLPALTEFRVPVTFVTDRLNGTIASSLNYPALSFLAVAPFTLLTHGVQSVIVENVVALCVETVLVFFFLPRPLRGLSVVVGVGLAFLFDNTIGGVILTLAMPFLLVVAYRWSDVGSDGRLRMGGIGRAACLGLAASISQFPWFLAPFLLIALYRLRSEDLGRRAGALVVARFAAAAGAVFLAVNAPFIVWNGRAWIVGIFAPLVQKAVPLGQGLIDATSFLHLGGGNLDYYSASAVCVLVLLLAAHAMFFDRLVRATFILPSVIFLFSTRSLSEYSIMMVATWLVSNFAGGRSLARLDGVLDRHRGLCGPVRRVARLATIPALSAVAAVCIALALATSGPLVIQVGAMQSNGQFRSIWKMTVKVTNRSGRTLVPHFATDGAGYMTSFWNVASGPRSLRPHRSGTYVLDAPNVGSMPGVTEPFYLQAVTASPDTMSSSALVTPEPFATQLSPSDMNRILALGQRVRLHVALRSPYGGDVHQRGVRVALGQIVYAQNALLNGEARINGAPQGRSPVVARTNAAGIATFTVSDDVVQQGNPVYFQAYVSPAKGYPYGYSEVVSIQWARRARTVGS